MGLTGNVPDEGVADTGWLAQVSWQRIKNLQKLGNTFDGFVEEFRAQVIPTPATHAILAQLEAGETWLEAVFVTLLKTLPAAYCE